MDENQLAVHEPEKTSLSSLSSSSSHVQSAVISDADIWNDDTWEDGYGSNNISTTSAYSSAATITGCTYNGKLAHTGINASSHSTALTVYTDPPTTDNTGYVG